MGEIMKDLDEDTFREKWVDSPSPIDTSFSFIRRKDGSFCVEFSMGEKGFRVVSDPPKEFPQEFTLIRKALVEGPLYQECGIPFCRFMERWISVFFDASEELSDKLGEC